MVRVAIYNKTGITDIGDEHTLKHLPDDPDIFIWADFVGMDKDHESELLRNHFNIDSLSIEDAQRERHPPKLEWFDNYYFLLLKGFDKETQNIVNFDFVQVAFIVSDRFLITRRSYKALSISAIWEEMVANKLNLARGPSYICYLIVNHIINRYTPIVLEMEQNLDYLEDEIFDSPSDITLEKLMNYKRQLKKLRRIFAYQQVLMRELSIKTTSFNEIETRHQFNDAYEHMERLSSLTQLYQELAVDLLDGYLSLSSHRLNQIMKILTIAAVVFLPLTFIAGIYGMNFEYMPELSARSGYFIVLGFMITMAIILIVLFRKLKWL